MQKGPVHKQYFRLSLHFVVLLRRNNVHVVNISVHVVTSEMIKTNLADTAAHSTCGLLYLWSDSRPPVCLLVLNQVIGNFLTKNILLKTIIFVKHYQFIAACFARTELHFGSSIFSWSKRNFVILKLIKEELYDCCLI